jgi:hypothetical protein
MGKTCPYCGGTLHDSAFKCKSCNKWVDNEVFKKLCEDDIKLIKEKDLTPYTPTLFGMMVYNLLKEDNSLKHSIPELQEKELNETQKFNLLVFDSFCFFKAALSVNIKQGRKSIIKDALEFVLLRGVVNLFNERVKEAPPLKTLIGYGMVLYDKFEAVLHKVGTNADSQLNASNALGAIVFNDDSPISFLGLGIYTYFLHSFVNLTKEFSRMFLLEDDDFNWQTTLIEK